MGRLSHNRGNVSKNGCQNKSPPLNTDKTLDQADAKTDEGNKHKHQQDRLTCDKRHKRRDPRDSRSHNGRNVPEDRCKSYRFHFFTPYKIFLTSKRKLSNCTRALFLARVIFIPFCQKMLLKMVVISDFLQK